MLATHKHASEMNVIAEVGAGSDATSELLSGEMMKTASSSNTFGLRVRRADAQNLPPIDTSLQIHDVSSESSKAALSTTLTINKSHKLIKIGFSDLSYTVKTGIWKRSEYFFSSKIYSIINLLFTYLLLAPALHA